MLSDRLLRLVGCPHPDPLSLSISDEIQPENLYFNYQSDLRICKIESGLDSSKPPGSVRFVYNHTSPSTPFNSKWAILPAFLPFTNCIIFLASNLLCNSITVIQNPLIAGITVQNAHMQFVSVHYPYIMYFLLSPVACCGGKWVITIRVITFTSNNWLCHLWGWGRTWHKKGGNILT